MGAAATGTQADGRRDPACAAVDPRLIRAPLEFLRHEHLRQRRLLATLDALAAACDPDPEPAAELRAHLTEDAPLHHADEDRDLLPLLRRRALPEDAIPALLARLERDHRELEAEAMGIVAALDRLAAGAPLSPADRAAMTVHAAAARRHLILEDAVALPLARARLTAEDRRSLSLRMALRRGVCLLREGAVAADRDPATTGGSRR